MLRSRHSYGPDDQAYITAIGNEPTIAGVLRDWNWRAIETSKGVYDFSEIDSYLKTIKALPTRKQFIIRIENRVFGRQTGENVPDYLTSDPAFLGGNAPMANGLVARIWDAAVMDRLIALYRALAARYDSDPNVEGISTSETSIEFNSAHPPPATFSQGALLGQLERLVNAARAAWPHSAVFVESNYLGNDSQMQELISASVAAQAVVGGPDVVPGWLIPSEQVVQGAIGGKDYRGTVAIKSEFQTPELGAKWSFAPAQLYAVAYTVNHANYMFWDRNDYYGTAAEQWATGILPFIRSVKGATYAVCPSSYAGGCAAN